MAEAKLTSKGQITIPKEIRDKLNLGPGDVLNFEFTQDNRLLVTPARRSPEESYGILYKEDQKAVSVEEMNQGVADYFKKKYKPE